MNITEESMEKWVVSNSGSFIENLKNISYKSISLLFTNNVNNLTVYWWIFSLFINLS